MRMLGMACGVTGLRCAGGRAVRDRPVAKAPSLGDLMRIRPEVSVPDLVGKLDDRCPTMCGGGRLRGVDLDVDIQPHLTRDVRLE